MPYSLPMQRIQFHGFCLFTHLCKPHHNQPWDIFTFQNRFPLNDSLLMTKPLVLSKRHFISRCGFCCDHFLSLQLLPIADILAAVVPWEGSVEGPGAVAWWGKPLSKMAPPFRVPVQHPAAPLMLQLPVDTPGPPQL